MSNPTNNTKESAHDMPKKLAMSSWILECDLKNLQYAHQSLKENCHVPKNVGQCYMATVPLNNDLMTVLDDSGHDEIVEDHFKARHVFTIPSEDMLFDSNKHCALVTYPDGCWAVYNFPTIAEDNDQGEIELPEDDVSLDGWLHNVLMLLFRVVEESNVAEEVFFAALIEYWVAEHAAQFLGNPAALVHVCNGFVAKLLKRSLDLWRSDPNFQEPRVSDYRFVWDIENLVKLYFSDNIEPLSLETM